MALDFARFPQTIGFDFRRSSRVQIALQNAEFLLAKSVFKAQSMNFKARLHSLLGLIACLSVLVFEWVWHLRFGTVHTMPVIIFGAGVTLTLAGLISPAIIQPTVGGKLSPLANKIGLVGFAMGGAMWFWLR